jgi:hypothetical protein
LRLFCADEFSLDDLITFQAMVRSLDLTKTETTRPIDRTRLLGEVLNNFFACEAALLRVVSVSQMRSLVGIKKIGTTVSESLLTSVRSKLRWSDSFSDLANFCVLLIKVISYPAFKLEKYMRISHYFTEWGDHQASASPASYT